MQSKFKVFMKRYAVTFVLAIGLIAGGIWSYGQVKQKQYYQHQLSNVYFNSYYDVVASMNNMEVNLAKLMVSTSPGTNLELLSTITRLANMASDNLSKIPASHPALADTMSFVNTVADYCGVLVEKAGNGAPLTAENLEQLQIIHNSCAGLYQQLSDMQNSGEIQFVLSNPEVYLDDKSQDQISQSLSDLGDKGVEYPKLIYDGPFSADLGTLTPRGLGSEHVEEQQAKERLAETLGWHTTETIQLVSLVNSAISGYILQAETDNGTTTAMITSQGGQLQWMMTSCDTVEPKMDEGACITAAQEWLNTAGYPNLAATWTQTYDGVVVINFAPMQDDVILYPDLIKAKVRMDTGQLISMDATAYLMNHVTRELNTGPNDMTRDEAIVSASVRMDVTDCKKCLIPTGANREVQCWEVTGNYQGDMFLIYLDLATGREINIYKVVDTPRGKLVI